MSILVDKSSKVDWKNDIIPRVKEELIPYHEQRFVPSLRTMFYRLVSLNILSNTEQVYKGLSRSTTRARESGVLPVDCFSDTTRRIIKDFNDEYRTIDQYISRYWNLLRNVGTIWKDNYPRWRFQPEYVEVWSEKEALTGTFQSILEEKDVVIVSNRGYSSSTFLYDNLKRLSSLKHKQHKNLHVLYFGDFDPSGENRDLVMQKKIDGVLGSRSEINLKFDDINFQRIAVNEDQIKKYKLPKDPDSETKEKLDRDTRTEGFKERHGGKLYVVELDAFPAIIPDVFKQLVINSVDQYFDQKIYEENVQGDIESYSENAVKKLIRKHVRQF